MAVLFACSAVLQSVVAYKANTVASTLLAAVAATLAVVALGATTYTAVAAHQRRGIPR
ncbi:hypothetical protein [Streptomyces sp. NPDC026673]|uniref:hypothetical protein n=1 Tax=Streptomyces sp. NPDC026673 TaxID=3155724 RepID=UPI0033E32163